MRRVVVTGLGVVSSLGQDVQLLWRRILSGQCGITAVDRKEFKNMNVRIGAPILPKEFDNTEWLAKMKERRIVNKEILLAFAASSYALSDTKYVDFTEGQKKLCGVSFGIATPPLDVIVDECQAFKEKGPRRVSPYTIPKVLGNTASGIVSMEHGLKGPNLATSTACAASSHAIGEAFRLIRNGDCDVMVAGGTEASFNPVIIAAFSRMNALTTKFNDNPKEASRPFDKDRSGFVVAEGAACLILEEYNHAKNRDAPLYAEILGYGLSGDAYHLTSPTSDGDGAVRCMNAALRDAKLKPEDISYINAHATSTPVGDGIENRAIKQLFGSHAEHLKVSSTKGSTGHLLAASGAIEAILTTLTVKEHVAPPTINLNAVSSESEFNLNYVPNAPQELISNNGKRLVALSNSFGFGGTNSCLCIGEINSHD